MERHYSNRFAWQICRKLIYHAFLSLFKTFYACMYIVYGRLLCLIDLLNHTVRRNDIVLPNHFLLSVMEGSMGQGQQSSNEVFFKACRGESNICQKSQLQIQSLWNDTRVHFINKLISGHQYKLRTKQTMHFFYLLFLTKIAYKQMNLPFWTELTGELPVLNQAYMWACCLDRQR